MTDHVRETITAGVVTALTNLTTTSTRIVRDRVEPPKASGCPCLSVSSGGESPERSSMGRGVFERRMRIHVRAHVSAVSGYGTTLNTILKECEAALANSVSGAKWVAPAEVEDPEFTGEGEHIVAAQLFTFEALYYTAQGAPDVPR